MFIILDGTKEEHLDMLDGGIIQKLLEEKWKTFARVCTYSVMSVTVIVYNCKRLNYNIVFTIFHFFLFG